MSDGKEACTSDVQLLWVGPALRTALLLDCVKCGERTFIAIQYAFPQLQLQAAVKSKKGRCGLVADPLTVGTAICVILAQTDVKHITWRLSVLRLPANVIKAALQRVADGTTAQVNGKLSDKPRLQQSLASVAEVGRMGTKQRLANTLTYVADMDATALASASGRQGRTRAWAEQQAQMCSEQVDRQASIFNAHAPEGCRATAELAMDLQPSSQTQLGKVRNGKPFLCCETLLVTSFWILELGPSRFVTAAPRGGLGSRQPFKPAGAAPPQSPDAEGSANAQCTGESMERWGLPPAVHWLAGTEGSASLGDRRGLSNLGCS